MRQVSECNTRRPAIQLRVDKCGKLPLQVTFPQSAKLIFKGGPQILECEVSQQRTKSNSADMRTKRGQKLCGDGVHVKAKGPVNFTKVVVDLLLADEVLDNLK